jgi:hypothetical protein
MALAPSYGCGTFNKKKKKIENNIIKKVRI